MNGKRKAMQLLAALAMAVGLAGCESGGELRNGESSGALSDLHPDWVRAAQPIMRSRNDPARGRLWILSSDGVDVYDTAQKQKLAHLEIPGWHWVHVPFACPPDLALGPKGEVLITSNVIPTLWRVDPETLAMSRHDLSIAPETDKDIGFTSLMYSKSRGAYYGVGTFDGTLWRIDSQLRTAHDPQLGALASRACGLAG